MTRPRARRFVPILLYIATWCSTIAIGTLFYGDGSIARGLLFAAPLMAILTLHEFGHYAQMRRWGIESSLPYFLPLPLPPFGTFGAIIRMKSAIPNRRALFDVGVSGPLAGLAATLVFLALGLWRSVVAPTEPPPPGAVGFIFGESLLFKGLAALFFGDIGDRTLLLHPTAIAGWVGLTLTTINLLPVSQLDGGHVFYALLGKRSFRFSLAIYALAAGAIVVFRLWHWTLFLILIAFFGLKHPRTFDDSKPLGRRRAIVGLATYVLLVLGFAPTPLDVVEGSDPEESRVEESAFDDAHKTPSLPTREIEKD